MKRLSPITATLPLPSPFARPPTTFAEMVAQVRRELEAETAVRDLWGGRLTAFVPILALRAAREALGVGDRTGNGPGPATAPD